SAPDLALGVRQLGPAELGSEAVVVGEVEQPQLEDRVVAFVVAQPDRFGAVVENLFGHTAEVVEGALVTTQKGGQGLGVAEVEIASARPTEREYEALHPLSARLLEGAPVDLTLAPRWGLEA